MKAYAIINSYFNDPDLKREFFDNYITVSDLVRELRTEDRRKVKLWQREKETE